MNQSKLRKHAKRLLTDHILTVTMEEIQNDPKLQNLSAGDQMEVMFLMMGADVKIKLED